MIDQFLRFLVHLYRIHGLLVRAVASIFRRPLYLETILEQMDAVGVRSLTIVGLTSFFTGMVLALQSGHEMAVYGAKMYVGTLVSLSLVRELGPVLTALVVAGRVGAGIAAELGSMAVTEQIDAMRALATDPVKKLVSTRLVATTLMLPILTIMADLFGILGGWFIAISNLGIPGSFYRRTALYYLTFDDLFIGLVKPVVFGAVIALVACYIGLNTTGGTQGVGRSTTQSVVTSSILIFLLDFVITKLVLTVM
jgi:phospholipid/cholesterol/gamma-HCH transport system permease protein